MSERNISVVAIDDHGLVLAGIRSILESDRRIDFVGEGICGQDVIPLVEKHQPDIVVLDMGMPQQPIEQSSDNGAPETFEAIATIGKITEAFPSTRIVCQ